MVVPGVIGYLLDLWLEWPWILTILGFAFGMTYGMYRLVQFANRANAKKQTKDDSRDPE